MSDAIVKQVEAAIAATKEWSTKGWSATFGGRKTVISNLKDAEAQPRTFVNRLEAIAYWTRVARASEDAAKWGERCLASLKKGDLRDADDSAYMARMIEHPMREAAPTWGAVWQAIHKENAAKAA